MSATNTNEPLRTTEHQPSAAPPAAEVTTDAAPDASVVAGRTGAYVPGQGAVPTVAAPEREQGTVSVPGYEIEGVLGRGGMGVVYKARHLTLKRTVALKMVLAGGHAGPGELARFRIEAEAVARLQHPNIVQIHEVGEADGHPYCALEFVEGGNLAGKLDGKPMPAREAAKLVEALARAMQLAHSRNVVHRDLKPANILLTAEGTPKITDFGLARQTGQRQRRDAGRGGDGHAVVHGPGTGVGARPRGRARGGRLRAGRDPLRLPDRSAAVSGKTVVETLDQVRTQEPARAVALAGGRAAGPGYDLPEVPAQGAGESLRVRRGVGGRPGSVSARRADPGAAGGSHRTGRQVGETQSGGGRSGGGRGAGPGRGHAR